MKKEKIYKLIFNEDEIGKRIYLNDYRICGNRPLGKGGRSITFNVKESDIIKAMTYLKGKVK